MNVTLPEALLLFALHDAKGTVHSVAFLAIDHALRAAVLAELKLRGHVQTRLPSEIRHHPRPPEAPTLPILRDALAALATAPSPGPVKAWSLRLAAVMPDLRERLTALLEHRGILAKIDRERAGLTDEVAFPLTDAGVEDDLKKALLGGLDAGPDIAPREGVLLALTVACHLHPLVVGGERSDAAEDRAGWVSDRDAIVAAATRAISEAEGEW